MKAGAQMGSGFLRKNVCMTYRAEFYKMIMPGRWLQNPSVRFDFAHPNRGEAGYSAARNTGQSVSSDAYGCR